MTLERSMPYGSYMLAPINFDRYKPVMRQESAMGKVAKHTRFRRSKFSYDGSLVMPDDVDSRALMSVFLHQTDSLKTNRNDYFWVYEDVEEFYPELYCGVGDGSKTSFIVPLIGGSEVSIFVDDVIQETGYTFHEESNYLTDQEASVIDGDASEFYPVGVISLSAVRSQSLDGMYSIKATPPSPAANLGLYTMGYNPVTVGNNYFGAAWYIGLGGSLTVRTDILWYNGSYSLIGTSTGTGVTLQDNIWKESICEDVAPASSVYARLQCRRITSSENPFWIDCMSLGPGDLDAYFIPTYCPGVVEFDSAPSSGEVITCSGLGKLTTRSEFIDGTQGMQIMANGDVLVRRFRTIELWGGS